VATYGIPKPYPADERFGLTSQTRRAASSIPANIAEGNGRLHRSHCVHHLSIARGSLMELDTHIEAALRLEYITEAVARPQFDMLDHVGRMLTRLAQSVENL
jgi:four helix bundle protein